MPRRRKKPNLAARLFTWALVVFLLAWGVRQLVQVRAAIVKDLQQNSDDVLTQTSRSSPVAGSAVGTPAGAQPEDPTPSAGTDSLPPLAPLSPLPPLSVENAPPVIAPPEALSTEELAERGRQIDTLIEAADQALQSGRPDALIVRRRKLNDALVLIGESARAAEVRTALGEMNPTVFLGPDVLPDDPYAPLISIEAGDTFGKIAQRYRITTDLLAQLNPQIEPRTLRAGGAIKVVYGPFHARLVKHEGRLDLFDRDMFVRSFAVQFDEGNFLPAGTYRLTADGKVRAGGADPAHPFHEWIHFAGAQAATQAVDNGCFYGSAGPRAVSATGLSGAHLDDSDLHQLYNALTEATSLVQVDP